MTLKIHAFVGLLTGFASDQTVGASQACSMSHAPGQLLLCRCISHGAGKHNSVSESAWGLVRGAKCFVDCISTGTAGRPNSLVDPIGIGSDVSGSSLQSHCHDLSRIECQACPVTLLAIAEGHHMMHAATVNGASITE